MSLPAFKNVNAIVNIYSFVYLSPIFGALWQTTAQPDLITFRPTSAHWPQTTIQVVLALDARTDLQLFDIESWQANLSPQHRK